MTLPTLFTITIALCLCTTQFTLAADETPAPPEFQKVRDFVKQGIESHETPSIAIVVVKENKTLWAEGFGYADLEKKIPATPDSIYILASISKPITATGLMILKDKGLIELDAPANRYLHDNAKLRAYIGSADDMTIRRLANHTSGMPLHYNFFYDGVQPPSMDETIRRYGFAATKPGTEWEYSNLAYGILDYITEIVSKKPWGEFMEKNVYDPLKMTHTSDHVRHGHAASATKRYTKDVAGRFIPVAPYLFDHPGASTIFTSAHDLARFGQMHLNGGELDGVRILSPETTHEMQVRTSETNRASGHTGNGVAWFVNDYYGQPCLSHTGGMPGVLTVLRLFPKTNTVMVVLTNSDNSLFREQTAQKIAEVLFPGSKKEEPATETKEPDGNPADFAGKWEGRIVHYEGDIKVVLEIDPVGTAKFQFADTTAKPIQEPKFKGDSFTGHIEGKLRTQPDYHGPVKLDFRLKKEGNRMTGTTVAIAEDYFSLSHWTELVRSQ